jgi:AsmA protein
MDASGKRRWPIVVGAVVGAVVLVVIIGLFVLDSVLTSKAHDEATKLSQQLGRPVTIGSVSTKMLTGFGAAVKDVGIGPAAGEGVPLAQVKRVDVRVALLRAIFSRGKNVVIRSAEVDGLNVNLIRFGDGTTNLERLQDKLAQTQPKEKKAPEEQKQGDLSFLRVDHAALRDARIALVDRSGREQRQLAIQHLDVTLDDLRAGKPLDVVVTAAVLAEQKNFELRLHAAPLPPTLMPTPERVTLKVQPIDLSPLAPYVPKDIGLQAGRLDANFDAQLGAMVPGGKGPTSIQGAVHALGLKFAGAEGGKALDVVLDSDVKGDAGKGEVQISKLRLDLGPAGITGQGRASGLNTPSPRIEGLEIRSHDLDPARLAAYYPPLAKQLKGQIAGPIGLLVQASGTQASQALELRVDLTPVKLVLPQTMTKAAGAPMTLVAHVKGASQGKLAFDANLDLAGADLRPGQSLDKAPGQRLELSAKGTRTSSGTTANPQQRMDLESVALHVLGDRIDAHGWLETKGVGDKATKQFDLLVTSDHLDLDRMLLPSTSQKKEQKPPPDPKTFAGLSGHATAKLSRVAYKKQQFQNVVAEVTMKEDQIDVQTASIQGLGGQIDAGGTRIKLAHPKEPWHVATKMRGIDLEKAAAMGSPKKVLGGRFDGDVTLDGRGEDITDLTKSLSGVMIGHVLDGKFYGKDIVASAASPVLGALPGALRGKVPQSGATDFGKDLPFGLTLKDGWARLKEPLKASTPQADMSFSGGLRLDGTLDMPGTVALTPATVQQLTGGRVKLDTNVPVGLRLVGPATSPRIADLDVRGAVEAIVKSAGSSLISGVLGGPADQKKEQGQQVAQQKQQELEQKAQQQADKAKQDAANKLKGLLGR